MLGGGDCDDGGGGGGDLLGGATGLLSAGGGGSELLPGLLPPLTCGLLDIKVLFRQDGLLGGLLTSLLGNCAQQYPDLPRYSTNIQDFCYYRRSVAAPVCQQCMDKSLVSQLGLNIQKCCNDIYRNSKHKSL